MCRRMLLQPVPIVLSDRIGEQYGGVSAVRLAGAIGKVVRLFTSTKPDSEARTTSSFG